MANANRTRAILAAQKVRVKTDPTPEEATKLTAEERKAIYAPKSAVAMIPYRAPMPLRILKTSAKITGVLFSMLAAVSVSLFVGESKRGFWS